MKQRDRMCEKVNETLQGKDVRELGHQSLKDEKAFLRKRRKWIAPAIVAFCAVLAGMGLLIYFQLLKGDLAVVLAQAAYPETVEKPVYDDYTADTVQEYLSAQEIWQKKNQERLALASDYPEGIEVFFSKTMKSLFMEENTENIIYSPLNIYAILAMTAEMTDGNSQAQILDALGVKDISDLRGGINAVLSSNYVDDGNVTSIFGNSVWLRNDLKYNKENVNILAQDYLASVYYGKMGSSEYNALLRDWLAKQTKEGMDGALDGLSLEADTMLSLFSTSFYQAKWKSVFKDNSEGVFYSGKGEINCDYMEQELKDTSFCWGDTYSATALELDGSGKMWVILPQESVTPEELLQNTDVMEMVLGIVPWENHSTSDIQITIPKFDVSSDMNLQEGLEQLGITDIFHAETADFSNILSGETGGCVSNIEQISRLCIDEQGCMAATVTNMAVSISESMEKIEFTVDHPFIVVVMGDTGVPLYMGVIRQP